ncbi:lysylphosphatidylglycerol synthase transmembrane domain-containing protein [Desulfosporosinus nitroreducens]|uniref:lysylphosphatidylglycerol synthase transmembrane domain-containing protein n=1 Tax=Desulfosporosinus nitroreducens TaxID=2018668 RepID=UPI00207D5C66|nr:lysylphosphatidylglycerol synthase transmembrane domain-containing protein [Desulfosporosinus nitroreducens]MCO1601946.1 flippase-like domain-containing protein [Desulfosporosinus nitroreducens]
MASTLREQSNFKRFLLPLKILASILMLSWMFSTIEWQQITQILLRVNGIWMAMALGWVVISVGVSAYKWQLILRASQLHVPLRVLWKTYWAGLFLNNFLPSSIGGDGLRIYWVGKVTGEMAGSTTSVVVERVLATIGLCLTAILAILLTEVQIPYLLAFFGAVMFVGILILSFFLFPHFTGWLQKRLGFLPKAQSFLVGIISHGMRLRNQPSLMFYALIGSVLFQMCVVMVNWCIFKALSVTDLNPIQAAVIIPATSVAAMLPIGINGYGVREGAYIALFAPMGISGPIALTASILFALLVSFSSLWGGWIWIKEGRQDVGEKRVPHDDREASRPLFQ